MRIAIPCWEDRISPLLDAARDLLILEVDGSEVKMRMSFSIADTTSLEKVGFLKKKNVMVLLCSAISDRLLDMLRANDIQVYPQNTGHVDEVIEALLQGRLIKLESTKQ